EIVAVQQRSEPFRLAAQDGDPGGDHLFQIRQWRARGVCPASWNPGAPGRRPACPGEITDGGARAAVAATALVGPLLAAPALRTHPAILTRHPTAGEAWAGSRGTVSRGTVPPVGVRVTSWAGHVLGGSRSSPGGPGAVALVGGECLVQQPPSG